MAGLDGLVFTGGVGENSPQVRALGRRRARLPGRQRRPGAQRSPPADREIGRHGAAVRSLVIAAREDVEIAHQVRAVLG